MRGLHHVAVGARDVERVARFYREVFGLPEVARHADREGALRSIWLDARGTLLMIEKTENVRAPLGDLGTGPCLLAFSVTTAERNVIEGALAIAGSPIESRSAYSSYARDPEGNRVAISHYPETAPA